MSRIRRVSPSTVSTDKFTFIREHNTQKKLLRRNQDMRELMFGNHDKRSQTILGQFERNLSINSSIDSHRSGFRLPTVGKVEPLSKTKFRC